MTFVRNATCAGHLVYAINQNLCLVSSSKSLYFFIVKMGEEQPNLHCFHPKGWENIGQSTNWVVYLTQHNGLIHFYIMLSFFYFLKELMVTD